jgi:hypothetical protein
MLTLAAQLPSCLAANPFPALRSLPTPLSSQLAQCRVMVVANHQWCSSSCARQPPACLSESWGTLLPGLQLWGWCRPVMMAATPTSAAQLSSFPAADCLLPAVLPSQCTVVAGLEQSMLCVAATPVIL